MGIFSFSNGCGSLEMMFDESPDSWVSLEPGFSACCHSHDLCYDTCNEDKDMCAKEEAWDKIMYYIDQMVSIAPQTIVPYRIMAAEIFITKLSRPRKGLRMIESIKAESKNDKQQNTINRLIAIAQKMIDDGLIEVGD